MGHKSLIKRNSALILSILGAAGVIATSILAARAAPKAEKRLDAAKEEKGEELTRYEEIKVTLPTYGSAIGAGVATIMCICGAQILNSRQQASLVSAYAIVDRARKDYRRKAVELYGEEMDRKIIDAIAAEDAEAIHISGSYFGEICDLGTDEHTGAPVLWYDRISDRYFKATIEQVLQAEYHLNRNYILRGYACLNELYEFLGISKIDGGDLLEWQPWDESMFWIEFTHRKSVMSDGTELYILGMPWEPELEEDS